MSSHHFRSVPSLASGALLATLVLALAGCGEEPTPPRLISFSPAVLSAPAKEALAVSVEYEENDFSLQDFQWTADAGEIEGNGAPSITYHAPADSGDYKIAVTVTYGDDNTALSLDSVVKVTPALEAEAPAVTEAIEPETSGARTAPAAEQAATATAEAPADASSQAVEEAATEEAAELTATDTAAPTEQPTETAEEAVEAAAPEAGRAVEEVATAIEQAPERATAAGSEGTVQAPVEEAATATVAAVREAVEEAGPAPEEAAERTAGEATEVTDEAGAGAQEAPGAPAAPAPGESARAGAEQQEAQPEPEPQVAALTEEPAEPATAAGSRLDQILDKHRLTAVVQIAFKPFSFYGEDGRRTGFEVDMVREFARRWLDDPKAVTFLPVPTDARIPTLQKGRADIVAAALTKTPARAEEVDLSLTYFKDGQQVLVRENSTVADVCDLQGKKVAAIHGSTSLDNIQAEAARCGFELGDNLVTFRRHDDALEALLEGQVEAYTSDGVALANLAEGRPLKVVGNHFSEEPYGFAVPKGDERLLELVNRTLKEMERDGTYAAMYEKWFGDEIRPYPLEESETVAATEVAALATTSAPPIVEPKTAHAEAVSTYVVQAGDTLSKIAGKVYGDVSPSSWERIYQANKEVIGDNPSRIKVGVTLTIPQ